MNFFIPRGDTVQLTNDFQLCEFDCNCHGCCNITEISLALVENLQELRTELGEPIHIAVGFRCMDEEYCLGNSVNLICSDLERLVDIIGYKFPDHTVKLHDDYIYYSINEGE